MNSGKNILAENAERYVISKGYGDIQRIHNKS